MPRQRKQKNGAQGSRPRRRIESFADWMARVDAEVEKAARKMERKSHAGGKSAPRLFQDASIPLVVFEGATLSPELKQKLARLTALSQKTVIAWAELRQQRNRWRQLRDELIRIDGWLHDEYAHICRELNPEDGQ